MADLRYDKVRTPYVLDLTQLDLNKIGDLETVWDRTNKVLIIRDGANIYKLNSAGATLLSPNGSKFKVVVSDDGTLTTELSDDPNVDGEVDQINEFITQINSSISIIEGKIVDIESDLIECDTKVDALKIDLDTIKPALDQSIIDAKAQNTTLTQTINESNTANSAMNSSIVVLTQLNTDLGNTSNISTVRKQELEEVIASIPTEVQKITDELLETASKNIVGAINEVNTKVIDNESIIENLLKADENFITGGYQIITDITQDIELKEGYYEIVDNENSQYSVKVNSDLFIKKGEVIENVAGYIRLVGVKVPCKLVIREFPTLTNNTIDNFLEMNSDFPSSLAIKSLIKEVN